MRSLRILALSDIHARFDRFPPAALPDADLVLVAGDLTNEGVNDDWRPSAAFLAWLGRNRKPLDNYTRPNREVERAREWLREMTRRGPIFWIPGNHDIGLDNATFADVPGCTGILDRTVDHKGLRIHGVSLSPGDDFMVRRWSYMTADLEQERAAYAFGPVDVVLSHCPPYGGLTDHEGRIEGGYHFGSTALREYIHRHDPRLVICGHVHGGKRYERIGDTDVHNCAERHVVIDLPLPG